MLANESGVTLIEEKPGERAPLSLPDRVVVIGDAAMATGFKLAGVSEIYVVEEKEGAARLVELLDRENVGIVIVKDEIVQHLDWRVKKRIETIAKPCCLPEYLDDRPSFACFKHLAFLLFAVGQCYLYKFAVAYVSHSFYEK